MADLIIFDWDGPIVDGQPAKDASWLLASLEVSGDLPKGLFEQLRRGRGIEQACAVLEQHGKALGAIQRLKGLSRKQTAAGVCRIFRLDVDTEQLAQIRGQIRPTLLESPRFCRPASGAVEFLQLAHAAGAKMAVVTQTTAQTVRDQILAHRIPDHFAHLEAAGDPFYARLAPGLDGKALAYAIACRRLGTMPWQALAIEDSAAGATAARRVGIPVIGLCMGAAKPMPEADYNARDLAALARAPIVETLVNQPPEQVLPTLPALVPAGLAP